MADPVPRRCPFAIVTPRYRKSGRDSGWYVDSFQRLFISKALADSFTRYWFYLLSVSGIPTQLKEIELACKDLFGELEDDPKLR